MIKDFILNAAEKKICSRKVLVPLRNIQEVSKYISMFDGQREYKSRKNDRDGFLSAFIRAAENCMNVVSDDMITLFIKLGSSFAESEAEASTNLKIFLTNKGKIWDGQHRYNWLVGFLNDVYLVPEQIQNESLSGLKFSELAKVNPKLAEDILNINLEFVVLDTDCVSTVAKFFFQMNSGSKKVSAKEGVLALKAATTSAKLYKGLQLADDALFPNKDVVCSLYSRTPYDSFVRNICYLSDVAVDGAPELTIKSFIEGTDGMMEYEFYKFVNSFGQIYEEISKGEVLKFLVNKYKGHTINALSKILYLIFKNIENEKGNSVESFSVLNKESIEEAGKVIRENQENIRNVIDEFVTIDGFKIGDSVKKTSATDELVDRILENVPSLGLN